VDIKIREELLHYLWQLRKFDHTDLLTTDGREIRILSYGQLNNNAGPDFLEGKVEMDHTLWAGHIEMHLKSSDWDKHNHSPDPAYHNVILHVVYEHDQEITRPDGTTIPVLVLKDKISPELITQYQHLLSNQSWIPCEQHIETINDLKKSATKERMMAERLIEKSKGLQIQLSDLNDDLAELVYRRVAYSFGLSVNGNAMEILATTLPYSIVQKHRDNLFQLEALLFGQSGLVEDIDDEYADSLSREYRVLAQKYGLTSMNAVQWKYAKLRPAAFPTIRIAQFAKLLHQVPRLDNLILTYSLEEIMEQLSLKAEGYWKYHYRFGTASAPRAKSLGKSKRDVIVINGCVVRHARIKISKIKR